MSTNTLYCKSVGIVPLSSSGYTHHQGGHLNYITDDRDVWFVSWENHYVFSGWDAKGSKSLIPVRVCYYV